MNSTDNPPKTAKRRSTSFPLLILFGILGVAAYYFDAGPRVMTYIMYLQESRKVRTIKESINKANPYVPPSENDESTPRVMSAFERAIQLKPEPQPNTEPEPTIPEPKIDEPSKETPESK